MTSAPTLSHIVLEICRTCFYTALQTVEVSILLHRSIMVLQGGSARATTPIDMNTPHDTGENAPSSTTDQRAPSLRIPDGASRDSSESPTLLAAPVVKRNTDWKKRAMIVDDPKVAGRDHPLIIHVGWNVLRGRACVHPSRCWPANSCCSVFPPFFSTSTLNRHTRPPVPRPCATSSSPVMPSTRPAWVGAPESSSWRRRRWWLPSNPTTTSAPVNASSPLRCHAVPITPRHFHLGRVLPLPLPSAMGRAHSELRRCGHRAAGWDRVGAFLRLLPYLHGSHTRGFPHRFPPRFSPPVPTLRFHVSRISSAADDDECGQSSVRSD